MDGESNLMNSETSEVVFSMLGEEDEVSCSTLTENSNSCTGLDTFLPPQDYQRVHVKTSHAPSSSPSSQVVTESSTTTKVLDVNNEKPGFARSVSSIATTGAVASPPAPKRLRTNPDTVISRSNSSMAMLSSFSAPGQTTIQNTGSPEMPLFEYVWPQPNSNEFNNDLFLRPSDSSLLGGQVQEWYIVQEVLSDYLQVNSFKRKYPDIARRSVDVLERQWLVSQGLVNPQIAELGLTALRSEDVLNLLLSDYPHLHEPVQTALHTARVQYMRNLQKEQYEAPLYLQKRKRGRPPLRKLFFYEEDMNGVPLEGLDASARIERTSAKLQQSRQRAVRSVQEYNHRLLAERLHERRYYWDLQTQQVHVTRQRNKATGQHRIYSEQEEERDAAAYPVALLPGQYAARYRQYSPEELMYLPLNTALYCVPRSYQDWRRPFFEREREAGVSLGSPKGATMTVPVAHDEESQQSSAESNPSTTTSSSVVCSVCSQMAMNGIRCTDCKRQGHAACLDLPEHIVPVVKSYAWSCMECKRCVECGDPGDEEAMLFCDKCDRGYHMYCVGLKAIPDGQWQCPMCDLPAHSQTGSKGPRRVMVITTGE